MMFSVPQFIDVEDKIAGPLTWRQLLWMIGMGAALLTVFGMFDTGLSIIISIPIVLIFCAMAFYRPNGFPMTTFVSSGVMFLFRPKVAVWERPTMPIGTTKAAPPVAKKEEVAVEKQMTADKLAELARIIDRR
ncbi:MAG: PrgI family protein [Candidatus Moraniibacteriota bacterium]|jgi:hypothetical protein|nr:MAG: PrgI family protein [Candidatus Moranbacteria bacterium]